MQEIVTLYAPGPVAGFPGESHGPGVVILDYDARTVTPVLPSDASVRETPPQAPVQESTPQPEVEQAPTEMPVQPTE
jgi:hypothetical protein